jgi:hypothetical protein
MAAYVVASIYYLITTRFIGTPFRDSLTAKQLTIKKKSADVRRNIFYQGIIGSIVGLAIFKPFHKCG